MVYLYKNLPVEQILLYMYITYLYFKILCLCFGFGFGFGFCLIIIHHHKKQSLHIIFMLWNVFVQNLLLLLYGETEKNQVHVCKCKFFVLFVAGWKEQKSKSKIHTKYTYYIYLGLWNFNFFGFVSLTPFLLKHSGILCITLKKPKQNYTHDKFKSIKKIGRTMVWL